MAGLPKPGQGDHHLDPRLRIGTGTGLQPVCVRGKKVAQGADGCGSGKVAGGNLDHPDGRSRGGRAVTGLAARGFARLGAGLRCGETGGARLCWAGRAGCDSSDAVRPGGQEIGQNLPTGKRQGSSEDGGGRAERPVRCMVQVMASCGGSREGRVLRDRVARAVARMVEHNVGADGRRATLRVRRSGRARDGAKGRGRSQCGAARADQGEG